MDFEEVRRIRARRRGADHRLEVTGACGTPVHQEVPRGTRTDHRARGRRERLRRLWLDRAHQREIEAGSRACSHFPQFRNNDKVGLVLFSDQIETFVPTRKGRQHDAPHRARGAELSAETSWHQTSRTHSIRQRRDQAARDGVRSLRLPEALAIPPICCRRCGARCAWLTPARPGSLARERPARTESLQWVCSPWRTPRQAR